MPGMPVALTDLKVGASAPEMRGNGRITGGRMFFSATGMPRGAGRPGPGSVAPARR